MRKSFWGSLLLIGLNSCIDDRQTRADYIIKNQTEYKLDITSYIGAKPTKNIQIEPQKQYKERVVVNFASGGLFSLNEIIDSIVIDFGSKRKIVQYCEFKKLAVCNIPKNLITIPSGYDSGKKKRARIGYDIVKPPIEVIFDQSDYDRAVIY